MCLYVWRDTFVCYSHSHHRGIVQTFIGEGDIQLMNKAIHTEILNALKRSGVRWLHFEVFSAIQV